MSIAIIDPPRTAKKPKPAAPVAAAAAATPTEGPPSAGRFDPAVPLALIKESPTNPRKVFRNLDDMAASIKAKGILQPLVIRPKGKGYEVVAGARRYRGAKLAAATTAPAMIRELTDEQVVEIQVIENNQREDVHPLEEADGIAALVKLGQELQAIADKLGRPLAYVTKRLQLTKLTPAVRKLWVKDQKIGLGYAALLSRLPAERQDHYAARWKQSEWSIPRSLNDLKHTIESDVYRPLSGAPWKKDDAALVPTAGACNSCPKRTGYDRALFDDIDASKDQCLDPTCYAAKQKAFVQVQITALTVNGVPPVLISHSYGNDRPKGAIDSYSVDTLSAKEAKKLPADQVVQALHCDGSEAGHAVFIRKLSEARAKADSGQDRHRQEQKKKEERAKQISKLNGRILDAAVKGLDTSSLAKIPAPLVDALRIIAAGVFKRWWDDHKKLVCSRHGWEKKKGDGYDDWKQENAVAYLQAGGAGDAIRLLLELVLSSHAKASWYDTDAGKEMAMLGRDLGVDVDALRSDVQAEARAAAATKKAKTAKKPQRKAA